MDFKRNKQIQEFTKQFMEYDPSIGKHMGKGYIYHIKEKSPVGSNLTDYEFQRYQSMQATKSFMLGLKIAQLPMNRYPSHTRRVAGRVWPGEARRRLRITNERKTTRAQVETLCKYMLFKNGKFIPGKMV
uniref:Uncharacterized protein n=1 Tax=Strombidium rassoulzadegani TaxID=1082188 RepID=A0A7S3CLR9_9SPIT|mmetsp:Transcript_13178/g.22341  ORF Transcript_13178/g.22341 Transcript_13178/m.22341 type:complete len:130 (+) Transcript_13178:295-684(+)|eukprot:CAMPEP_0168613132 /NCGR_PEP_ID=MMETSP0449_2-20121227/3291_1 /TAXON_ID=1082188 /ORGANISM="Strombidium rassoulzadegani, Strain ras09" /LENGTH=129 /DNA_ID=CAMNT_0008653751 /DNA_START=267 /DNA_END=656 /DNA_ORIENTATION=+